MALMIAHTLERMGMPLTSVTKSVQAARETIEQSADRCAAAAKLIGDLLSLTVKFEDEKTAVTVAQAVVEAAIKAEGEIGDEVELYEAAVRRAAGVINKPENKWMYFYVKDEDVAAAGETKTIEGTELKVAVKADGKIKRGGKQQIAEALFKKHVIDSTEPCDNACFVKILMKEAGMTLAGARTYAHNCRKAAGLVDKK